MICLSLIALTLNTVKNMYFAKLEGTPQPLTILQYSQQIRTSKWYLFFPKIPGTRALGGHLSMYKFAMLAAAQIEKPST